MLFIKLISALLIFVVTLIAGFYPFFKKYKSGGANEFPIGEALSCGIFLGAGLLHMLSDSSHDFVRLGYGYPFAFLLAGSTFLVLLFLEHVSRELYEHGTEDRNCFAIIALVMMSIHSFLAGAALGLSPSLSILLLILLAIVAHKWAASFALSVQINRSHLSQKAGIIYFMIFAFMTPIGILFGHIISSHLSQDQVLEPIFTAMAAGTFLYLGTLHGLKRAIMVEKCCNLKHFTWVIIGFAIMAVLAIWT